MYYTWSSDNVLRFPDIQILRSPLQLSIYVCVLSHGIRVERLMLGRMMVDGQVDGMMVDGQVAGMMVDGQVAGMMADGQVAGMMVDGQVFGMMIDGQVAGMMVYGQVAGMMALWQMVKAFVIDIHNDLAFHKLTLKIPRLYGVHGVH